jgi:tetratricopeptide (TPR) repeat protein
MIQFFIPAVVVLIAVIIITVIVLRHFPQAASIDLESLPAEQEAAMKAALMERRLKRKILEWKNKIIPLFRKIGLTFSRAGKGIHKRVAQMEQRYRQKPSTMTSEQQEEVKQKIRQLLQSAKEHSEEEHWAEAESKYIEVLSWDHKNLDAYFGLGEVYIARKEHQQAKETLMYLLKLVQAQELGEEQISIFSSPLTSSQINEAYYDYALALQNIGDLEAARHQMAIAIERDSKNPKYLDKAVELNILLNDRVSAQDAFNKLKNVNPENQKLSSLEARIRELRR